jgi:hypothetical protein
MHRSAQNIRSTLRDEAGRSFGPAPSIEVNSTILGKTRRTRQAMQSAHSAL